VLCDVVEDTQKKRKKNKWKKKIIIKYLGEEAVVRNYPAGNSQEILHIQQN
jgi:hypothetical protein